jgi:hypothetical protein
VHLESEPSTMGMNWRGRRTRRFGPAESFDSRMKYGATP